MKKSLTILVACLTLTPMVTSASAAEMNDDTYKFIGFGLTHYDDLENLELSNVDIDLVPEVFVGFGKNYQLNQNWQLATEISLHYAKAHFNGLVENTTDEGFSMGKQEFSGNYEALGLWATSRFKYVGFSEKVSPFIELAVGAVETNHGTLFGEENNRDISYKAVTGLEFEIDNDMTFSIGLGVSDNDNNRL